MATLLAGTFFVFSLFASSLSAASSSSSEVLHKEPSLLEKYSDICTFLDGTSLHEICGNFGIPVGENFTDLCEALCNKAALEGKKASSCAAEAFFLATARRDRSKPVILRRLIDAYKFELLTGTDLKALFTTRASLLTQYLGLVISEETPDEAVSVLLADALALCETQPSSPSRRSYTEPQLTRSSKSPQISLSAPRLSSIAQSFPEPQHRGFSGIDGRSSSQQVCIELTIGEVITHIQNSEIRDLLTKFIPTRRHQLLCSEAMLKILQSLAEELGSISLPALREFVAAITLSRDMEIIRNSVHACIHEKVMCLPEIYTGRFLRAVERTCVSQVSSETDKGALIACALAEFIVYGFCQIEVLHAYVTNPFSAPVSDLVKFIIDLIKDLGGWNNALAALLENCSAGVKHDILKHKEALEVKEAEKISCTEEAVLEAQQTIEVGTSS